MESSTSNSELLTYLEQIDRHQKKCMAYHEQTLDKLDLIVELLSKPSNNFQQNYSILDMDTFNGASPSVETTPAPPPLQTETDNFVCVRSKATSDRNFAVHLVRKLFGKNELEGHNVRGVAGKQPLEISRVQQVRDQVFKHYPVAPSEREKQWCNCRKAIDSYIRGL